LSQDASSAEELKDLLVQWNLTSYEEVLVKLGVERVSDLEWVLDADLCELELPKVAHRKMQAMLEWCRKENTNAWEPLPKRARVDQTGEVFFSSGGVGGIERGTAPALVSAAGSPAAGAPVPVAGLPVAGAQMGELFPGANASSEVISLRVRGQVCPVLISFPPLTNLPSRRGPSAIPVRGC